MRFVLRLKAYAITLLQEKGSGEISLKAMGRAINKTLMIAELVKEGCGSSSEHSNGSTDITDVWEPLEEGLLPLETTRHVSVITITLSKKELDTSSTGYQPPIPVDQVKPGTENDHDGEDPPSMQGGQGGQGRGRNRVNINNGVAEKNGDGRHRFGGNNGDGGHHFVDREQWRGRGRGRGYVGGYMRKESGGYDNYGYGSAFIPAQSHGQGHGRGRARARGRGWGSQI